MRLLYIFILTLFFCNISYPQELTSRRDSLDEVEPYDYDTTLRGGYTILFKSDDSLEYLFLKKGDKIITKLSSCSRGMLHKNLGYVVADFTDYFVLAHSFGSGNPHYIELIKKATGKNILRQGAAWIDVNLENEILLYSDSDVPTTKNKMTLYNVRTGQKQSFGFPDDIFNVTEILNRIQIDKLTDKFLVIRYDTESGSKTKVYSR
jgi:hypothetical protein